MAITRDQCQELLEKEVITKAEYNTLANMAEPLSAPAQSSPPSKLKKRKTAALLGILLGSFWAQKIYLKQINPALGLAIILVVAFAEMFNFLFLFNSSGVYSNFANMVLTSAILIPAQIVLSVFSALLCANAVLGMIEGIIYLTLSDEKFQRIYVDGLRKWF